MPSFAIWLIVAIHFLTDVPTLLACHSATGLWIKGSGIPASQSPHVQATGAVNPPKYLLPWEEAPFINAQKL